MRITGLLLGILLFTLTPGQVRSDPDDLFAGYLITHAPADFVYSAGMDWCSSYGEYGISHTAEQIVTMPITADPLNPTLFFVVAAFEEDKTWCATEFGFSADFNGLFYFTESGPCLAHNLENATDGWPGPGEGTAVVATDVQWEGNLLPVYFFIGYTYYESLISLDVDPAMDFAGFGNCELPSTTFDAVCLGAMGVGMDGHMCGGPGPVYGACCVDGEPCDYVVEDDCTEVGATFFPHTSCDPDPCVTPAVKAPSWGWVKAKYRPTR